MNIAIDIRNLLVSRMSGVGTYTCALVHELTKDTSIEWYLYYNQGKFYTLPQEIESLRARPNVHIVSTRYPNKIFNVLLAVGWVQLDRIVEQKAKLRSLHWFFLPNLGFASVSKKVKVLLAVHDLTFACFPGFYSVRMRIWHHLLRPRMLVARADAIVVPSESTKHDLETIYGADSSNIHVIPHGAPLNIQRKKAPEVKIPEKFFLALSTIEPRKNFEGIITAYKKSGVYRQGVELVIVGAMGWKSGHILELFKNTPGVTYLGYVTEGHKHALLSRAYALVYPSFYEGFGLPILEAFSVGTPVITSDRSSLPEVCDGAAYLVRPHMVSDIAHALQDLAGSEKLRVWYGNKGRERVKFFSWEKAGNAVLKIMHAK